MNGAEAIMITSLTKDTCIESIVMSVMPVGYLLVCPHCCSIHKFQLSISVVLGFTYGHGADNLFERAGLSIRDAIGRTLLERARRSMSLDMAQLLVSHSGPRLSQDCSNQNFSRP